MNQLINLAPEGRLTMCSPIRFRSPLALAAIGILLMLTLFSIPALADGGAVMYVTAPGPRFFCGNSMDVTFGYTPDEVDTPVLRGYSIRITAPYGLAFDDADIVVNSPLGGVNDTYLITMNGEYDYTIDFTFLDPGEGLSVAADLFTITFRDREFNIPNTLVGFSEGRFRDLENQDIVVDISATVRIDVVCVSPTVPDLDPEPTFTPGTTNSLSWSDESEFGAFSYNIYMSTDAGFSVIVDESGWIPGLSHEFTGLSEAQDYYFKVVARNFTYRESEDSPIETTIQDAVAPVTSIDALDPDQYLLDWDLPFQATDATSGFDKLELFYRFGGGAWTSLGDHTVSPIGFTAVDGDGLYEFYSVGTDVAGNLETVPAGPQASTTLDTSQPFGSFVVNDDDLATNNPEVMLNISVIRAAEMRFSNDGATWPEGWVTLADDHSWTIPTSEEVHTVYGEFRDAGMQVMPVTDDIEYDITPTGPVTAPAAAPGHETVLLTWTNPADADFHSVDVWRGLVHDGGGASTYPSYIGSVVPTLPADRDAAVASAEWELAGRSDPGATSFVDSVATRGIYHYEFFAADPANNFSTPTGLTTRATNYILGDVAEPHDGLVQIDDLTVLGATYLVSVFNPLFNGICDVGPTHNGSGSGIPEPDDQIDNLDHLIFAMNFAASAKSQPAADSPQASGKASLAWIPLDNFTWALNLVTPCPTLKGVGLSGNLPPGVVAEVAPGEAINNQSEKFHLLSVTRNSLEASLVILGPGRGFTGTGTLLTVTLPAGTDMNALSLQEIQLDLRDINSRPLAYELQGKSGGTTPAAFWLAEAYPNPFNPATTIRFSIAADMPVRLEIYGMDGRRVAVLVDETLAAGPHESVWLGRDDTGRQVASGVYFSKLLAGSQSRVRKMTLMK